MIDFKNAFVDEDPNYFKDVFFEDTKIAKIKYLTQTELMKILGDVDFEKLTMVEQMELGVNRILASLVSWEFDRELTAESLVMLHEEYKAPIFKAVDDLAKLWNKSE